MREERGYGISLSPTDCSPNRPLLGTADTGEQDKGPLLRQLAG